MLALIDYCEAVEAGKPLTPKEIQRRVLGIDIDIRETTEKPLRLIPCCTE